MIKVLNMTIHDLDKIKDILITDFDDFWSYTTLKSEIENPLCQYIVAKKGNVIVGFAGIIDTYDQMEITNIVVKKEERNKGIGDILLKELIKLSKKRNALYLEVNENNITAIKLYEKNGFKKCGLRKKYYKQTEDAILMNLKIN